MIHITKYDDKDQPAGTSRDKRVSQAIVYLKTAHRLKQEADGLIAQAYKILGPFHLRTGARQINDHEVGGATVYQGSQTRLDKDKFTSLLMKRGVKAKLISECMDKATKKTDNKKLTVKFTPREKL